MQFRIAAAQIKPRSPGWERVIVQRAEKVQLRTGPAQSIQTFLVLDLEGFVPRHGNHRAVLARLLGNCGLRLPPGLVDR